MSAGSRRRRPDAVREGVRGRTGRGDLLESLRPARRRGENPARTPIHPLVDPGPVAKAKAYDRVTKRIESLFGDAEAPDGAANRSLELLRAPARHSPTRSPASSATPASAGAGSSAGARRARGGSTSPIGVLRRGGARPPPAVRRRRRGPGGRRRRPSFAGAEVEPERFSTDRDWMPRLVLLAKSTYVWLDQLSKRVRPRDPDARRDPGRGAGRDRRARDHRALADRAVAALAGLGDDQALARQRGRGRLAPTRSTTTGSPTTSAARTRLADLRTGPGRAASGSRATWSRTTWGSTRAG